jgi:hypothetical protein
MFCCSAWVVQYVYNRVMQAKLGVGLSGDRCSAVRTTALLSLIY